MLARLARERTGMLRNSGSSSSHQRLNLWLLSLLVGQPALSTCNEDMLLCWTSENNRRVYAVTSRWMLSPLGACMLPVLCCMKLQKPLQVLGVYTNLYSMIGLPISVLECPVVI